MLKAWIEMWKNTFCYTGTTGRKTYWQALIMNLIAMYVFLIPAALIMAAFIKTASAVPVFAIVYILAFLLPTLSLYFRRARDAGWKTGTALYAAVLVPGISGLIVGMVSRSDAMPKENVRVWKALTLAFGLFLYGSAFNIGMYADPGATPIPLLGLLLGTGALIAFGIRNWRTVLDSLPR